MTEVPSQIAGWEMFIPENTTDLHIVPEGESHNWDCTCGVKVSRRPVAYPVGNVIVHKHRSDIYDVRDMD